MGSSSTQINNDHFRQTEWHQTQKFIDFQVWKSNSSPWQHIEQYDMLTNNDDEFKYERQSFQLRKRSPLLVASYYFQSHPKDHYCSTANRHSLFIERIPIRLEDVEHIPYPDYLHLFDAALKGFAQLSNWVGYFPVEEGMIGISQQGVVKVWMNEDLASSRPFGKASEAQMIANIIEAIDRNIDHNQLPSSTPTLRNFLYRNSDSLTFDIAIREFAEFVRNYNAGQVPIRLECIDEAGGVYAIANRDTTSPSLKKSNVRRSQVNVKQAGINIPQSPLILQVQSRSLPSQQTVLPQPLPQRINQPIYYQTQPFTPKNYNSQPYVHSFQRNIQPTVIKSQKVIDPYVPRVSNAPKYTVQITPGKVYPLKNSTIVINGSSKVIPHQSRPNSTKEILLSENIQPRLANSQRQVQASGSKVGRNTPVVEHVIREAHEDNVLQEHLGSDNSSPQSKRSMTQVLIPEQVSGSSQFQYERCNIENNYIQFRDTVSIPQESAHNSLAVSFNPAYEDPIFVNKLHQTNSDAQYDFQLPYEGDQIRQTAKFAQTNQLTQRAVNFPAIDEKAMLHQDDLIRETGKFNLQQSASNDSWRNQKHQKTHFDHIYNQHQSNHYAVTQDRRLAGREDYKQQLRKLLGDTSDNYFPSAYHNSDRPQYDQSNPNNP